MAESHPFANAGLGMFGTAERQFALRGMNPEIPKEKSNLIGGGIASILKSFGVGQGTVDKINGAVNPNTTATPTATPMGTLPVIPPSSSYKPFTPQYGIGVNPAQQSVQQPVPNNSSYFTELNENNEAKDTNFIDSFKIPRVGGL
jgi:hypothetical protein